MAEEEEDTYECTLCGRPVPVLNRTMHSLVCARHEYRPTPEVQEVEVEEEEDTASEGTPTEPSTISHPNPASSVSAPLQSVGSEEVSRTAAQDGSSQMVECEYCELPFPAQQVDTHAEVCGSRTDVCSLCLHYCRLRDFKRHIDSGCTIGSTGSAMRAALSENEPLLQPRRNSASNTIEGGTDWTTVGVAVGAVAAATALSMFMRRSR